jgi:hypothetical protein
VACRCGSACSSSQTKDEGDLLAGVGREVKCQFVRGIAERERSKVRRLFESGGR